MRKVFLVLMLFLATIFFSAYVGKVLGTNGTGAETSCRECHSDPKEVLPDKHKAVKGDGIGACLPCHPRGHKGATKPNPFFSRLHKAHASNAGCGVCHAWIPGQAFSVIGQRRSLGTFSSEGMESLKKNTASWSRSTHLDGIHANKELACGACHDKKLIPDDSESRENSACIKCHGSLEKVAAKNTAQINPHRSHLGEINCTTCHHSHGESRPFCTSCHAFSMKIPGAAKETVREKSPEATATVKEAATRENVRYEKTDVVIIGSGAAGLTAALTAHEMGAKVIVLEAQPIMGGNSMSEAGGINAADTRFQRAKGIKDSPEFMQKETMAGGKNINDPQLVMVLAKNSADSLEWLTKHGADLSHVGRLGGASVDRAHRPGNGTAVGAYIINTLRKNISLRYIDVRLNSKAIKILKDKSGRVSGVLVKGKHTGLYGINAGAVITAAGEGMDPAAQAGAESTDMKEIQVNPTIAAGSKMPITEAMRGNGAIMVNSEGITSHIHYAKGRLKINASSQVIGKDGKLIPGFFAAGEAAGGVHGANSLEGDSISAAITFGRIAGSEAVEFVKGAALKRPARPTSSRGFLNR